MKKPIFKWLWLSAVCAIVSCQDEEGRIETSDSLAISEEAMVDAYFQDADDLAALAVATPTEQEYSGGRKNTTIVIDDHRFACDGVVVTIEPHASSTAEHPNGVIVVDFGTEGCTDLKGITRKGKILFHYDGWRHLAGSTVITTTENYSVNGVKLEGTRTSTNITESANDPLKFHVVLENGVAVYPNNAAATRESDITWSWIRGANASLDKLIVHEGSSANGVTRAGREYAVAVLADLEYQRTCGIAIAGRKQYRFEGNRELIVDYGDGGCDNEVTISMDGVSRTITVN